VSLQINPVRFLEAQMACLRLLFVNWLNSEPDELETDCPTEEQLHEYEESEKRHQMMVSANVPQAFSFLRRQSLNLFLLSVHFYGTAGFPSFYVSRCRRENF
jgi:hypothetical protein